MSSYIEAYTSRRGEIYRFTHKCEELRGEHRSKLITNSHHSDGHRTIVVGGKTAVALCGAVALCVTRKDVVERDIVCSRK